MTLEPPSAFGERLNPLTAKKLTPSPTEADLEAEITRRYPQGVSVAPGGLAPASSPVPAD
jgi:hypothetical protein